MVSLTDLIKEKVSNIDLDIKVSSVVGSRVYVCKTLFLSIGKIISDENGFLYVVTDFLNNEWVELEKVTPTAPMPYEGTKIICQKIHFFSGTPTSVNNEYHQMEKLADNKMPAVWLNETYLEKTFGRGSSVEREVTPQIFFMDQANEQRWTNEEQHRLVLQPLNNLQERFYETFKKDRMFKTIIENKIIERARFGVYIDNKGNVNKIINEYVSAVETQPTLIRYKKGCEC